MDNILAEIDLSNQINNSWNKDSVLALKKSRKSLAIKIRTSDKKGLKRKFIWETEDEKNKKHNQRVITIIYCFMLYKLIKKSGEYSKNIRICNDAGPRWAINKYLNAILRYFNEKPIGEEFRLKFRREGDLRSPAHNLAKKVMKGRRKEDFIITKKEIIELEDIIRKIL